MGRTGGEAAGRRSPARGVPSTHSPHGGSNALIIQPKLAAANQLKPSEVILPGTKWIKIYDFRQEAEQERKRHIKRRGGAN